MFESKAMLRNFISSLSFSIVGTAARIARDERDDKTDQTITERLDAIKDGITDGEIVSAIDVFNEVMAEEDAKKCSEQAFANQGAEHRLAPREQLTLLITLRRKLVEELSSKPNLTPYDKPTTVKQAMAEMFGYDAKTMAPLALDAVVQSRLARVAKRNIVVDGEVRPYIDGMCEVIGIPEDVFVTLTRKRIAKDIEQLRAQANDLQALIDDSHNVTIGAPVLNMKEPHFPERDLALCELEERYDHGGTLTRAEKTKMKRGQAEWKAAFTSYELELAEYKRAKDKFDADHRRYNEAMHLRDDVDNGSAYEHLDALGILANMPSGMRASFLAKFERWLADAKGRLAQYGERMGMATLLQEAATLKLDAAVIAQLSQQLSNAVEIE